MNMKDFFRQLDLFYEKKEMQAAESYMRESLNTAENEGDFGAVISICSELGGYYRVIGRFQDGFDLYEKALIYIRQLGLEDSEHHATTLMNYANTCAMSGNKEKALSLYGKAGEIFKKAGLETDYRVATLYNNMSLLCQQLKQYDQSVQNLNIAMDILKQLTESEVEQAITYTNLAQIQLLNGCIDEAKFNAKKAIDMFEIAGGDGDTHYAVAVNVCGEIYYKEGNYDSATES